MGKLSKRPPASKTSEETSGQTKISTFFKNGPSKENKPRESRLFQQIGSSVSAGSRAQSSRPPLRVSPQEKIPKCGEQENDVQTSVSEGKDVEILQPLVIPETQILSSPESSDSKLKSPQSADDDFKTPQNGKCPKKLDMSASGHVTSDDEGIIPGTPDFVLNNRPRKCHRSFLRPTALLAKQPDLKPLPVKTDSHKQKARQLKKRLSAGGVSVAFKKQSNSSKEINPDTENIGQLSLVSEICHKSEDNRSVSAHCKLKTARSPTEKTDELTPSRKRPAVSGISPSPKRISCENYAKDLQTLSFHPTSVTISPVAISSCESGSLLTKNHSNNKGPEGIDKRVPAKGRQTKPTEKQIRQLNNYQCSTSRKLNIIEDSSVTCADDDVLADILGELHSQLSCVSNSRTENGKNCVPKGVKEIMPNRKSSSLKNGKAFVSKRQKDSGLENKNDVEETDSVVIESCSTPALGSIGLSGEIDIEDPSQAIQKLSDLEQPSLSRSEYASLNPACTPCSDKFPSEANVDDADDCIPDDDSFMEVAAHLQSGSQVLCEEFNSLSPFKAKRSTEKGLPYDPMSLRPASDEFGRHTVTAVQFDRHKQELVLTVESTRDSKTRTCHLQGFWCDTKVMAGDTVHILGAGLEAHGAETGVVSDSKGLVVVHPDRLISGTSVVSGVHCLRRSVLNEIFKGVDSSNIYMLHGSIIHSFFQEAVQKGLYEKGPLLSLARSVISQNKFLHDMYSQSLNEESVQAEVIKYIPPLQTWLQRFTNIGKFALGSQNRPDSGMTVTKIQDIEENIWSPRFGVKGKIDLTVEAKIWGKSTKPKPKVVPLELKTGKATYSVEHKGQVTIYSMMSSDRRDDPEMGLLLYLKEGDMQSIAVNNNNKAGLIQLRNDMAHYLENRLQSSSGEDGKEKRVIGRLPEPINSRRTCEKCPQLLNCTAYLREVEQQSFAENHPMSELVPATLSHLSQKHLDYLTRWCLMLELEGAEVKGGKNVGEIWTVSAADREKSGSCLGGMVLAKTEAPETNQFILTFVRHRAHPSYSCCLDKSGLTINDTLVVSAENKTFIALCMGTLVEITRDHIKISTDRDLGAGGTDGLVYRLDRVDVFNTMGLYFTNLSRLMADNSVSANLRRLLIDEDKPVFMPTLSKGAIEKVRSIFKTLNKPQKTAILKVLMCKDYILVKGYPGTGKTSTIVSLVRVLQLLGHSVLLASYTHSAVDNILIKLKQANVGFLRLGRLARIHPSIKPYAAETLVKDITSVNDLRDFYTRQDIVATTCLGSNHVIFSQRRFDVCVVDEASQVLQPACLGPLFSAQRFVLVGDHKQLPPVVQSRAARNLGMAESLFSRLDKSGVTYELNLQYRMNSVIMELSNELIYGGALQCGSQSVATSCLQPANHDTLQVYSEMPWILDCLNKDLESAAIFLDTKLVPAPEDKDNTGQIRNVVEGHLLTGIAHAFVQAGVDPVDVGVIAPYRNQVKLIKSRLTSCNLGDIEVNTVDQYQGRDKSVILISFVKSSNKANISTGELLSDIRRLNVAVTRAKHKLVLVGNRQTLDRYEPVAKVISVLQKRNKIISLPPDAHKDFPKKT